ncbi:ferric iron reductase FhuF-like transporter-domain-containing protein, partial [Trichophaea hybrida]
ELNPGVLFSLMYPWLGDNHETDGIRDQTIAELEDSASNQQRWFEIAQKTPPPELYSPSIEWEKAMIRGHPTHPMHRTCLPQPPLKPLEPGELDFSILNPELSFVSVPCADVRHTGPFQQILSPLLSKLNVAANPSSPETERRIIVPCLTRQLPSIRLRFPNAVKVSSDTLYVQAQSSLRTVNLPPELGFPYHLKFPLACKVTSAVRTITPWTTCVGPELSELLGKLLPDEFWVFNEVASLSGSQEDFSEARHLSCLIREDLEIRANGQGEALVVASALAERDVENYITNAERVFELDSVDRKKAWFREYARGLFSNTIPLLVRYGICLESHGQNILVRLHLDTGAIVGFAVRDLGGVRIHVPTLHKNGYDLKTALPGSSILTDDLHEVWSKAHHTLIQNNMNQFIRGLRLQCEGGWAIAREELKSVLQADEDENARRLEGFLFAEKVPVKSFMRMQMAGVYRHYLYKDLPNILLR